MLVEHATTLCTNKPPARKAEKSPWVGDRAGSPAPNEPRTGSARLGSGSNPTGVEKAKAPSFSFHTSPPLFFSLSTSQVASLLRPRNPLANQRNLRHHHHHHRLRLLRARRIRGTLALAWGVGGGRSGRRRRRGGEGARIQPAAGGGARLFLLGGARRRPRPSWIPWPRRRFGRGSPSTVRFSPAALLHCENCRIYTVLVCCCCCCC